MKIEYHFLIWVVNWIFGVLLHGLQICCPAVNSTCKTTEHDSRLKTSAEDGWRM